MNPIAPRNSKASQRVRELAAQGQSVWLDFIKRGMLADGSLQRMIADDGLLGMTSNPAIFEKAIAGSADYERDLASAALECASDPKGVFERLAIADIRAACDLMAPVYAATKRIDGYVSLEVAPDLAHDQTGTVAEAKRLWEAVARPNVMIKVPATPQCIPAIRQLLSEGINVNITLLFSVDAYDSVAAAWLDGLEYLAKRGGDVSKVASVASFFVSRIDSYLDPRLEELAKHVANPADRDRVAGLAGKVAIANAKVAYQHYLDLKKGPRWAALSKKGAMPQRLLWASTGTKNPKYSDVLYVDALIGAETVETIPPSTYDAFQDHGTVAPTLTADVAAAHQVLKDLGIAGVSLQAATDHLLTDGVKLFKDAYDKLLAAVAQRGVVVEPQPKGRLRAVLPPELQKAVEAKVADWKQGGKVRRLWDGDAKLWTGGDEGQWLGWLQLPDQQKADAARFTKVAADMKAGGFTHVCLLGMGGSSLCPEVWAVTFGKQAGFPELVVLDSTDPQQVAAVERRLDLTRTLFCVSSKSGSTLEPNIFKAHFFERVKKLVGAERAAQQFIAVTDPGSSLEKVAQQERFRAIHPGVKSVGGRYSALTNFGLVPAAAMGLDVAHLIDRACEMKDACGPGVAPEDHPGVLLGAILGCAAKLGRDKVTLVPSPTVHDLGAWIEQLLAESTGKIGRGLIPVDRETLAAPERYGADRVFLSFEVAGDPSLATQQKLAALEAAGHPVVHVPLRDAYDIAAEFFRLEVATAVAGEVLAIHPFDQPDVEASKLETKKLTAAYEQSGKLPPEQPFWSGDGVACFADAKNAAELKPAATSLTALLRAHLGRAGAGDYAAFLAYVDMNPTHEAILQELRHHVRDSKRVATCLGFGPRFLHSTGQAYKGGPNRGVFVQITAEDARDVAVPGAKYTFGIVKAAQARGDFEVLAARGRRALRIHLGSDVAAGLAKLRDAVRDAMKETAK